MIVKMPFEEFENKGLGVTVDDKKAYIIITANHDNITSVIEAVKDNPWVVGVQYFGNPMEMSAAVKFYNKNVYFIFDVPVVTETTLKNIDYGFEGTRKDVRIVLNFDKSFADMRIVKNLCQKYANASVMGGDFVRLQGCNYGEIWGTDLPKAINTLSVTFNNDYSVQPIVMYTDVAYTFHNEPCKSRKKVEKPEKSVKTVSKTESKPKKQSKISFAISAGMAGF